MTWKTATKARPLYGRRLHGSFRTAPTQPSSACNRRLLAPTNLLFPNSERGERVTPLDAQHLAGYYDICPWDATDSRLLRLRVPFADHHRTIDDKGQIAAGWHVANNPVATIPRFTGVL